MTCFGNNKNCNCLKIFDIFDKNIQLYYKGRPRSPTYIGSILTIIYGLIYFLFFLYKLINMFRRTEVLFYDTYAYIDEPQIINLTNDNFYGGFALEDPETYDPFIDETIYYPRAYFKIAKRIGEKFSWETKNLTLETCKLEKFGSFYRDKFKNKNLKKLYCFTDIDEALIGHFSYDYYSFFFISFYPCINTTENNNHCKPIETIDYYLKSTFVSFQMQDIEITPLNFSYPARPKSQDIYSSVGKKLFQEIHVYFQLVNIETDLEFLGFSDFYLVRTNKYLKYDSIIQMTNLIETDIYDTGESFCDVTIKLTDKVLTEKRRYTKLIEVLRDVGGFMEVMLSIFKIISHFSSNIIYEKSLVNNLFSFDIDKKTVIIKNDLIKNNELNKEINIFNPKNTNPKEFNKLILINEDTSSQSKNKLYNIDNENSPNKDKLTHEKNLIHKKRKGLAIFKYNLFNKSHDFIKEINKNKNLYEKKRTMFKKSKKVENIYNNNDNLKDEQKEKRFIIDKIKINKVLIYLCFLFTRKRKNIENILLDEGMRIISQKLDIIYIFKKLYKDDDEKLKNEVIIEMSDICKNKIESLNNIH